SEIDGEPDALEEDSDDLWDSPSRPEPNSLPEQDSDAPGPDQSAEAPALGEWVAGPADAQSASRVNNAVLTTEDRDASSGRTMQASGKFHIQLTPQTIDTMFPSSTEPNPFCQPP